LRDALAACWHAFIAVGLMSGLINMLYLTGSFYMLEVYDRVSRAERADAGRGYPSSR
jgi:ABC-type protease/lipase transport system fused ATPase/permease subunit